MITFYSLRPCVSGAKFPVLPAVDPVSEPDGAHGVIVAEILPVKADSTDLFLRASEPVFAERVIDGVREAGQLITLDVPNSFPILPIRTDGPYVVWLAMVRDSSNP